MEYNLNDSLGYLLNIVRSKFKYEIYHILSPYGITPDQWTVLTQLSENDGKTQTQLADETFKDDPNIARILRKLENKGYILRSQDVKDKRIMIVFLSQQGKQLTEQLMPLMLDYQKKMEQHLSIAEILALKALLKKLRDNW
jgi:DNA-binding MarR family transcriptional regulator